MSRIPAGKDVGEFVELQFKPGFCEKTGVPERGCRIRFSTMERLVRTGGRYEVADLILGLMDWLDVTDEPGPALSTLRQLLDRHYPADGRETGRCHFVDEHGVDRLFHAGPINPKLPSVAWQRGNWIIAAGQPAGESGRLLVGAPAPITLNTARRILSVSMLSHDGQPYDSFAGAHSACGRTAAFSFGRGLRVTPTRWDDGLTGEVEQWGFGKGDELAITRWLPPNQLAMQVAIAAGYQQ